MIQQRRGGWKVTVYAGLDPLSGRRRYVTRQVNGSRRQAEKVEARLKTEVTDGRHTGTRVKTFAELLDVWVEWRAGNGRRISPRTLADYRSMIQAKIKPALGAKPLGKIDARMLDAFYDALRRRGNAKAARTARAGVQAAAAAARGDPGPGPATVQAAPTAEEQRLSASRVHDAHVIIAGALGLAVRWGWLPFSPATVARPAPARSAKRPVPTPEQVRELFAAAAAELDFEAFVRLSATTGLRPGEICALRWCDVDLDGQVVDVNGAIVTATGLPGGFVRSDTKSVHGERLLAVDPRTVALLRAQQARCRAAAEAFDGTLPADGGGYVFPRTPDATMPMRPDAISRRFSLVAERLGHGYTLYGLRHFMATQLGAVASVNTLRQRMGHGSLAVTSGYTHRVEEADRAAARYMADLLDGDPACQDEQGSTRQSDSPAPA